jgi:hypothetical protein
VPCVYPACLRYLGCVGREQERDATVVCYARSTMYGMFLGLRPGEPWCVYTMIACPRSCVPVRERKGVRARVCVCVCL